MEQIGLVVGVLGFVLGPLTGYYFYRKSIRQREPWWSRKGTTLIRDYSKRLPGMDILYDGNPVPNLTITKILFWNHGAETIDSSDVSVNDPLRIETTADSAMLDVRILASNLTTAGLSFTRSGDRIAKVEFEFFDKGQGFVAEVIHTGDGPAAAWMAGTIKGAGHPVLRRPPVLRSRVRSLVIETWLILFGAMALPLLFVARMIQDSFGIPVVSAPSIIFLMLYTGGALIAIGMAMFLWLRRFATGDYSSIPKGLEVFLIDEAAEEPPGENQT